MQGNQQKILKMKEQLKAQYPQGYAFAVISRMRRKGKVATPHQVYQFFNNVSMFGRKDIWQAGMELLKQDRQHELSE